MGRINGANSDYQYSVEAGGITEVASPDQLTLSIYLCPHNMPSPIEQPLAGEQPWCHGTGAQCPAGNAGDGHALIRLHETEGIQLETNNHTRLIVDQQGKIILAAQDRVEIRQADSEQPLLTIAQDEMQMNINGATISIDKRGNINLKPGRGGTVRVDDIDLVARLNESS